MRERVIRWIVWHMPRSVIYWAGVRLWAHGTQGAWGNTEAPTLRVDQALRRWEGRE
jgi:hypothetical protein